MANCELNQIFLGEIVSVQNYGAFIRIPGCSQQGLIHRTQVSKGHVDNVTEVLQRGERVWCKIISIGTDGKIGLSMKYVNQGNGTDLDPNGIDLQSDLIKKKSMPNIQRKTIQLEAVLNTTCTKCGTHGHLSNDCFMSPDGKKYELIPDIEVNSLPCAEVEVKQKRAHSKHKEKKLKKRKKSKESKLDSDSDDEGDNSIKKQRKKHSKSHKRKKRKHDSTSSDDSPNGTSHINEVKVLNQKHLENIELRAKKCKHSKTKRPHR